MCVITCLDACASSEGAVWRGKYVPPRAGWSHLSAPFPRLSSGPRRLHPPGVSIPQGHTSTCVDGPPWWPSPVLRGRGLSPAPLSGQWLATPQALSACAFPAGGPGGAQLHPGRASDTGLDGGRAWPGAAGAPHAVCAWGSPSRPQSADSLTAGAQRDAEEEEVTPPLPKSSGSVISSGPAGARGYETLGSLWSRQPGA